MWNMALVECVATGGFLDLKKIEESQQERNKKG
jgi:hypothetical protein